MDAHVLDDLQTDPTQPSSFALAWLGDLGLRDPQAGLRALRKLANPEVPRHVLHDVLVMLEPLLADCPDPDMSLMNLVRWIAKSASVDAGLNRLRVSPRTTEILVQLFSTSQYFSDLIIGDPDVVEWLRAGPARYDRNGLFDRLWNRILAADDDRDRQMVLRRFRHREMLRIGYNDVVRGQPLEVITQDLSLLAEVCVEAACRMARARAAERHGEARGPDGRPLRFVVLALGKLGGEELNYSSDIDLIFMYERDGHTSGRDPITNSEFFARVGSELIRLLDDHTPLGQAYRVDMRLRPEGRAGALARSFASTLGYYETSGRTWERQALIKCRPVAGDLSLGREFLTAIAPFVYRRFLSAAEIFDIKALKRTIEQHGRAASDDLLDVKTGRGGIRDVEFAVQFLQLLHGGLEPRVRTSNTLAALAQLEEAGCLTSEERAAMDDTYRFLRKVEHRLQIVFDRQTHSLPRRSEEQRALAIRMGYHRASAWEHPLGPSLRFLSDYRDKTEQNRRILNHLLHDAFGEESDSHPDPLVDLVLDPDPPADLISNVLGRYRFRDVPRAYRCLMALAREDIEFLSQPRCRHFLAAIAPALLRAVAATSDPDRTLANLERVSASLGAKAILWELFQFNPPSLRLYVQVCATSQFLSEILINNPGMIDDLIDSLVVDRPRTLAEIRGELSELCFGAEDLRPILLSFRNKEWLRIGARDILEREPIRVVTRELADVAEAILRQVTRSEWRKLIERLGIPRRASDGQRARWAVLALGKLGGRELSYHGDLDLVFLYDEDGTAERGSTPITNSQLCTQFAQRVIHALESPDQGEPLYRVDTRLRPHGSSGPLAISLASFRAYYRHSARAWERLALTRARVVSSVGGFGRESEAAIHAMRAHPFDHAELAQEALAMRRKLAESRSAHDLKRGQGGLVDIEFLVQFLQLAHPATDTPVKTNVWDAIESLRARAILTPDAADQLSAAYEFLRGLEARFRLLEHRVDVQLEPGHDHDDLRARSAVKSDAVGTLNELLEQHTRNVSALFRAYVRSPGSDLAATTREGLS